MAITTKPTATETALRKARVNKIMNEFVLIGDGKPALGYTDLSGDAKVIVDLVLSRVPVAKTGTYDDGNECDEFDSALNIVRHELRTRINPRRQASGQAPIAVNTYGDPEAPIGLAIAWIRSARTWLAA